MSATSTRSRARPAAAADAFLASLENPVTAAIFDANLTTRMLLSGATGDTSPLLLIDGAIAALQKGRAALVLQRDLASLQA
ncbi:hypothetical protein [Sulfuritalea sp.]|uniref:hypothetical protein n=1 Tax=Sulfuritalea sp. TaxID=2480090 RepID=UPI001AD57CB9|nr:hypothetical protein [Sulfuritalea sp.]MBN8474412.1 hypothetical protein [Sulfuritalea sp.]